MALIASPSDEQGTSEGGEDVGGSSLVQFSGEQQQVAAEKPHEKLLRWSDPRRSPNIAQEIKEQENGEQLLTTIGSKVLEETKIDEKTRTDWLDKSKAGMDLAMMVAETKTTPWMNASNVIYPLIAVGAIQFAARAYPAIIADRNVVRGIVFGGDDGKPVLGPDGKQMTGPDGLPMWEQDPKTGEPLKRGRLRERADRVGEHMSWQYLEEQPEWEPETDKLLHILPIVGCVFRKTYFDPAEGRNFSVLVHAKNLIVNYWAKSLETATRVTEEVEYYPYEIEEMIRSGVFLDQEYGPADDNNANDPDAPLKFYEQHRRLDLDGDGYPEPYIVTAHKTTGKVARITARFDPEGVLFSKVTEQITKVIPVNYYTQYDFLPNPEGGIYGIGFGQLLRTINESINTTLNQMFDAGTLRINGGGFIGKGLSMHGGAVKFKMGEWKVVNTPGRTVRESVVPMEHPPTDANIFNLLTFLVDAGKDVASIKDILTGERTAANMPATTILALIEQGLKTFTAIFKRVHRALKSEYAKQYRLNRFYLEEESQYLVGNQTKTITRQDYVKGTGIAPVSDPTTVSDMQKLGRAEFLKTFMGDPYFDPVAIRRRMLEAAQIDDIDNVLMEQPLPNPELMLKKSHLDLEHIAVKAKALERMAMAYKNLADGDAAIGQLGIAWVSQQLDAMRAQMEALDGVDDGGSTGQAPAGQGGGSGSIPGLGAPPGNAGLPPVPPGLPGGVAAGSLAPMGAGGA